MPVSYTHLDVYKRQLRGRWDRGLYSLFRVGVGLDVGPVYENRLGGQISRFRHLFQYPRKDLVHGFCGKPMTEIITHRGKMRRFLLKRISKKPTAADICADLIRCSPQGRHAVQMLNQHHFEQHNRVHTCLLYTSSQSSYSSASRSRSFASRSILRCRSRCSSACFIWSSCSLSLIHI